MKRKRYHSKARSSPILFTLPGIITVVSLPQLQNAKLAMVVTPFPIVTDVRLSQLLNAFSSMTVTLSGIVTDVRLSEQNANFPILVTGYPSNDAGMTRLPEAGLAPVIVTIPSETEYDHSMPSMIFVSAKEGKEMANARAMMLHAKRLLFMRNSFLDGFLQI